MQKNIEYTSVEILYKNGYTNRNGKISAKKIAENMGVNLSLVLRRIRALKAEEKVYYSSANGRGEWIIVNSDTI